MGGRTEAGPLDRGLLAAHASAGGGATPVADWPLGECNRALAALHCELFGGVLRGYSRCGKCGEQLEFGFDAKDVATAETERAERVTVGRWMFRLPTSRDVAVAAGVREEGAAVRQLVSSCWTGPEQAGTEWSDTELEAIEDKLAEADPLAEIRLHFDCPECGNTYEETLDLGSFVWAEIESAARRLFEDVHVLASAYGWTEREALALSPARRGRYIEMVMR